MDSKKGSILNFFARQSKSTAENDTESNQNITLISAEGSSSLNCQEINLNEQKLAESKISTENEDFVVDVVVNKSVDAMNYKISDPNVSQYLHTWKQNGRNNVYCKACVAHPEIVKRYTGKNYRKPPPITTKEGTQFRNESIKEHFKAQFHIESVKAMRLKTVNVPPTKPPTLDLMISKANEKRANFIGNLALSVFNDAKRLTLAAWNWPSRIISSQLGNMFDFNNADKNAESAKKISLEYVNPGSHAEILECIVDSNKNVVENKIRDCLALSLRCDGSVDRTNIDKIYVLARIVNKVGDLETVFVGVGEKTERKTDGLFGAVKKAINAQSPNLYQPIMKKMSSFVTDGAPENVGSIKDLLDNSSSDGTLASSSDKASNLWKSIDSEVVASGSLLKILKIWCAAHRSDLSWKCVSKRIKEVQEIFTKLSEISSHFHVSALRFAKLKDIAKSNNLKLLTFPKVFEVRWSQFTYALVHAVLISWHCLVKYFQETQENVGILNFLQNFKKLQLLAFIADVLFIFQRFQKKIQADDLNMILLHQHVQNVCSAISELEAQPMLGGWELSLKNSIQTEETENEDGRFNVVKLKDIYLSVEELERRGAHNKKRQFGIVRAEILKELIDFVKYYMKIDDNFVQVITPFVNLDTKNVNMIEVHKLIAPDVDISSLSLQFRELCECNDLRQLSLAQLTSHLAKNDKTSSYGDVLTVLARISAATPHSADAERCISANNLLKTPLRNSVNLTTENNYLNVHYNMPTLTEWDAREAVINWIKKKDRRQTNTSVENVEKNQRHFVGVFPEAKKRKLDEDLSEAEYLQAEALKMEKKRKF